MPHAPGRRPAPASRRSDDAPARGHNRPKTAAGASARQYPRVTSAPLRRVLPNVPRCWSHDRASRARGLGGRVSRAGVHTTVLGRSPRSGNVPGAFRAPVTDTQHRTRDQGVACSRTFSPCQHRVVGYGRCPSARVHRVQIKRSRRTHARCDSQRRDCAKVRCGL